MLLHNLSVTPVLVHEKKNSVTPVAYLYLVGRNAACPIGGPMAVLAKGERTNHEFSWDQLTKAITTRGLPLKARDVLVRVLFRTIQV